MLLVVLNAEIVNADTLECDNRVLVYDGWDDEVIYDEADLFADEQELTWGTEVCYVESRKRWLNTWIYVRTPEQTFGWLDEKTLLSDSEFKESARTRYIALIEDMQAFLDDLQKIETLMLAYDDQILAGSDKFREVALDWFGVSDTTLTALDPEGDDEETLDEDLVLSGTGTQSHRTELVAGLWTVTADVTGNEMCILGNCIAFTFSVTLEPADGSTELLFLEMGEEMQVSTAVRLGNSEFQLVQIDAEGDWTLTFHKE